MSWNQGPGQTSTWDMDRLHWIWWSICGYAIPNFQWWLSSNLFRNRIIQREVSRSSNLDLERRNGPSHQQLQIYHPKDKRHGVVVKAACNEKLSWNTLTQNPTSNLRHTGTIQNIEVLAKPSTSAFVWVGMSPTFVEYLFNLSKTIDQPGAHTSLREARINEHSHHARCLANDMIWGKSS